MIVIIRRVSDIAFIVLLMILICLIVAHCSEQKKQQEYEEGLQDGYVFLYSLERSTKINTEYEDNWIMTNYPEYYQYVHKHSKTIITPSCSNKDYTSYDDSFNYYTDVCFRVDPPWGDYESVQNHGGCVSYFVGRYVKGSDYESSITGGEMLADFTKLKATVYLTEGDMKDYFNDLEYSSESPHELKGRCVIFGDDNIIYCSELLSAEGMLSDTFEVDVIGVDEIVICLLGSATLGEPYLE